MMADSGLKASDLSRFAETGATRIWSLVFTAALLSAIAWLSPVGSVRLGFTVASISIAVLCIMLMGLSWRSRRRRAAAMEVISDFIEKDGSPSIVASEDGEIVHMNAAARAAFPAGVGETLPSALRTTFANPGGMVLRLRARADIEGTAREDVVTRKGQIRMSVHAMGNEAFLWRLETLYDTALSVGEAPGLPMVMVGSTDAILFVNSEARELIGHRVTSLDGLFLQLPYTAGSVCDVSTKSGKKSCLVAEMDAGSGRRALYLLPDTEQTKAAAWSASEDLPVPIIEIDPQGRVSDFNGSARSLLGNTLENGADVIDLMEGLGRPMEDWLNEIRAGRAVQRSEFLRLKNQEKETFVQVSLKTVEHDTETRLIAVLTDATELKTLEAQFVQSQKMQAIGQLAGGVAHDFNNLLTAISGHCDLLLLRHDAGDADYADLMQINQNANRAAALVGQLLAFSRKQTLRTERLDLRETLSDLTHLLNRLVGEKVTLSLSHDPVLPTIRADKRQLEQVLMNLVVNARDAMPEGGQIRIETERMTLTAPLQRDRVKVPEGQYVGLRVIDEGVGIQRDKLQKVFEPFFTTKRAGEGTGLGLSTAYGIVKQTGGFIFVDSEVGSGTAFTLMFPVLEETASRMPIAHKSVSSTEPKHGDGVILLVEDEAPVRAFASRALRLRGYTVLEADSAEAALRTLEDQSLNVDLFVTDVVMPGKDGPSWVREALKERPDVRVVFVSGYAEDRLSNEKTQIPNSVFLPKPFSLNDLAETVHKQLH